MLVMAHKERESEVCRRGRHGVAGTKAGTGPGILGPGCATRAGIRPAVEAADTTKDSFRL